MTQPWPNGSTMCCLVAVELVLGGTLEFGAELHRPVNHSVRVLDVNEQEAGRALDSVRRRCLRPSLRRFVLDDDDRIANLDFGVGNRPAGPGKDMRSSRERPPCRRREPWRRL